MPEGCGKICGRIARVGLALVLAVTGLVGSGGCQSRPADHASRAEVIAFLRREGAYQPATMRVRSIKWRPDMRKWLVDVDRWHEETRFKEQVNLTVNDTATSYRDDTCRF